MQLPRNLPNADAEQFSNFIAGQTLHDAQRNNGANRLGQLIHGRQDQIAAFRCYGGVLGLWRARRRPQTHFGTVLPEPLESLVKHDSHQPRLQLAAELIAMLPGLEECLLAGVGGGFRIAEHA